jgi:hypothetical protein
MVEFFRSLFSPPPRLRPGDVRTSFLFVEPSALTGAGRVIDLWGGFDLYSISRCSDDADLRAVYADWRMVGQDIRDTLPRAARELIAR